MVLAFAAHGADVAIASRKLDTCEALAAEVREATGRRHALAVGCHVGRWDECDALVERVEAELGPIGVLVNNAGMSPLYAVTVTDITEDVLRQGAGGEPEGPVPAGRPRRCPHGRRRRRVDHQRQQRGVDPARAGRAALRGGQGRSQRADGRAGRTRTRPRSA